MMLLDYGSMQVVENIKRLTTHKYLHKIAEILNKIEIYLFCSFHFIFFVFDLVLVAYLE